MGLNANWTRLLLHFWWFSFIKLATQLLKTLLFTFRIWLLLHFISIFSSMCYATWATIPLGDFPSSLSQGKSSIIFLWLLSNRGATNHKMDGLNTLLRLLFCSPTKIFRTIIVLFYFFRHWKYFCKPFSTRRNPNLKGMQKYISRIRLVMSNWGPRLSTFPFEVRGPIIYFFHGRSPLRQI